MREDKLEALVNYGDYEGTAAADRHDQRDLNELAKKYDVDTDQYFVFGVDINVGETRRDKLGRTSIAILAVDKEETQAGSVDFIQQYVDKNEGELQFVRFDIPASLEEVLLSFKRFNVVLTNSSIQRVERYQQITE